VRLHPQGLGEQVSAVHTQREPAAEGATDPRHRHRERERQLLPGGRQRLVARQDVGPADGEAADGVGVPQGLGRLGFRGEVRAGLHGHGVEGTGEDRERVLFAGDGRGPQRQPVRAAAAPVRLQCGDAGLWGGDDKAERGRAGQVAVADPVGDPLEVAGGQVGLRPERDGDVGERVAVPLDLGGDRAAEVAGVAVHELGRVALLGAARVARGDRRGGTAQQGDHDDEGDAGPASPVEPVARPPHTWKIGRRARI
jgi:hypothetical protein